jgi:conjugative relaxase-like TrwC/TraI family protein
MLRVRTIYAGSAASAANYYTRYLTDAPGEVPGVWTGDQAALLGLGGEVDGNDLLAVLEGRDPASGTPLGRALVDRQLANGDVVRAVAGFDATFSAPKSVSVLWALTHDTRLLAAHDVAVSAALEHLERYGSTTRVRVSGGRLHPDSQGLTIATFRQTTSREDDPQLHTHAVITAKVQTVEGRWLALDARYLKKHQRMLGGLYQSVLRNELSHQLGVAWDPIVNSQAEISGVPGELCELFSKRSAQVEVALAAKIYEFTSRQGRDPNQWELGALTREAAVDTRTAKTGASMTALLERWTAEAEDLGWTAGEVVASVREAAALQPVEPSTVGVSDVVERLSLAGSTWNRAEIVGAICDVARPNPTMDGDRWAQQLDHWCEQIIAGCVELDPTTTTAPRRASDGRSLWLEPISTHLTTESILSEEELVMSWALDAQIDEPRPSATVDVAGLDALQADVAAAVAGHDRLVLVVGPAGAGKTTSLRAAVTDLNANDRDVFGLAPSAKAARVLERETSVASDTVAKLLYEWDRHDRPPQDRYRLAAGTTVIVDEAGMIGTPSLARLVALADQHQWRLVLVGDHHQLQAVGCGGLLHELCTHGHTLELTKIHRFNEPWEAAASLQLRRGDPTAVDAYIAHDRVIADRFDRLVDIIADQWISTHTAGGTSAISASSNDHVDAINAAIQRTRLDAGDLGDRLAVPICGGERAHIGDIVVTRRNDRHLVTDTGEPVRNRDRWTVTGLDEHGSFVLSSQRDNGRVQVPVDYVRQHVRLGYAATEHGHQGDTTTIGIELASEFTTRRALYVAATRGQQQNLILVVADRPDLDQARDTLTRILATDRADTPAVTQRQELARADPTRRHRPAPPVTRCQIPDWFEPLQTQLRAIRTELEVQAAADGVELDRLGHQLDKAFARRTSAEHALESFKPALDTAFSEVRAAQEQVWAANNRMMHTTGRQRRVAQRAVDAAGRNHRAELAVQRQIEEIAAPARDAVVATHKQANQIQRSIDDVHRRLDSVAECVAQVEALDRTLDTWNHWAHGRPVDPVTLADVVTDLQSQDLVDQPSCHALGSAVSRWAERVGIDIAPRPEPRATIPTPAPALEIDM